MLLPTPKNSFENRFSTKFSNHLSVLYFFGQVFSNCSLLEKGLYYSGPVQNETFQLVKVRVRGFTPQKNVPVLFEEAVWATAAEAGRGGWSFSRKARC